MATTNIIVGNIYQSNYGCCRKVLKIRDERDERFSSAVIYVECDQKGIPKGKQKTANLASFSSWAHTLLAPVKKGENE